MAYIQKNNQASNADTSTIKKVISKQQVVTVQTEIVQEERAVFLKKENMMSRYLKIQPYYQQKQTVSKKPQRIMPELKICGYWLAEAGFEVYSYVSVTVMDGLLVIRPAVEEE